MTYQDFEREWRSASPYVAAKTSGSTGAPKEIRLLKSDMLASARATNSFFGISERSTLAIPLSCDYIAGKMMAVRAYAANCRLATIEPKNDFELGAEHVDLLSVVPSQVDCLLKHPEWAARIDAIIIGGAPIDQKRTEALKHCGFYAFTSYGMTETCSHVALAKIGEPFRAMPEIDFEVDDRGCLVVNCSHMSVGRVVTNDVVNLIDGRTFAWLGRYDNVINSGGIKIFPEILEKEISKFIDCNFYIVGVPDEKWGQAVQMVVEGDESMRKEIENALQTRLDHKFLPKSIHFMRILPCTRNGKLRRIAHLQ